MPSMNPTSAVSPAFVSPTSFDGETSRNTPTSGGHVSVDPFERVGEPRNNTQASTKLTALQKHVMFFDQDGDGKITVGETFDGLRELGFGYTRSSAFAFAINAGLGVATGAPWYSPLTVDVANIAKGKHDSDTDIYDDNGRFDPAKFKELFALYDTDNDDALSAEEFEVFYARNKESEASSLVSTFEFGLLIELAGEPRVVDGRDTQVVTRQTMERFYDGSLFFDLVGRKPPFEV